MAEKRKKPEIRFTGYATEWIEKKFDETFDMLSNNTLSRDALNYDEGVAKNIHYGDVLVKFGEYLDVNREKLPYINDATVALKFLKSYLKDGDIIIADTAEDESVGKCTEVIHAEDTPVISGLHTIPCRPKQKYAPKYMGYYLNSNAYHDKLLPLMQGVKVTSISRTGIKNTDVILSDEFEEQAKIGEFLSSLDDMIAFESSKYEKLTIVKKSMLEKMFPKYGRDVPEIRFNGFTDSWKKRKLGEVTFLSGVKNSDNMPYESYSISNENGFIPQNEQFEHGGTMRDADKSMYYIVSPQSFAYNPARINVGSIGYQNLSKSVIVSSLYEVFKTTDECDDGFLWYWMKTDYFQRLIERYQEGGVRLYFYYDKFCKGTLSLPNVDEQQKIGVFFTQFDNLITLHQHRIEKLKNIKSSCMEKMFV